MKKKVKAKKATKLVSKKVKAVKSKGKVKRQKVATIADGVDIIKKEDGTLVISGKNANELEGAMVVERKEREYKFDDRLVPYFLGSDSREGNLVIRDALIKLGKTEEMTNLFAAIKEANLDYNDDGTNYFIKALTSIIKGHTDSGLLHIYEEDIRAIEANNLKVFEEFFRPKEVIENESEFEGFSN